MIRMSWKNLVLLAMCLCLLPFPAMAADEFQPMMYTPGECVIIVTEEQQTVCQYLLSAAAEGAQKHESFWQTHRLDQLDERLRSNQELYADDDLPYIFCTPAEDDISAEQALFIAYQYLMSHTDATYDALRHFYPDVCFISTEQTGAMWWLSFKPYDDSYDYSYRVFLYAEDGSIADFRQFVLLG